MQLKRSFVIGIISVLLLTGCSQKETPMEEGSTMNTEESSEHISTISGTDYDRFIKIMTDNDILIDTSVELDDALSKSGTTSVETIAVKSFDDGSSYSILYNTPKEEGEFSLTAKDLWKELEIISSDNKYKTQYGYYYEFGAENNRGFYDIRVINNNIISVCGDLSCKEEAYNVMNQLYDWKDPETIKVEE